MIIGDGMADLPLPELDGKTPLEAVNPNNLNRLVSNGFSGLLDPISPEIIPGTETAHLSILGYTTQIVANGRGPFEAAGAGIDLKKGDIAFRCNFAQIDETFTILDERAGRIGAEASELVPIVQSIQKIFDIQILFKQSLGFKGALVLRGENLSANVSAYMPKKGEIVAKIKPLDDTTQASRTAEVLNYFIKLSYNLLNDHPVNLKRKAKGEPVANVVLPWSGGKIPVLESFNQKYGLNAACIAAASVIKGICKLSGMSVLDVEGATGEFDTNALAKADAALKALSDYDFVLLHLEAADEASHDGNIQLRVDVIKKIDAMVGRILDNVNLNDTLVVLLSDHVTSTQFRQHTADPVPIAIANTKIPKDGVTKFSEKAATAGSLRRIQGKDVMPLIMDLFNNL